MIKPATHENCIYKLQLPSSFHEVSITLSIQTRFTHYQPYRKTLMKQADIRTINENSEFNLRESFNYILKWHPLSPSRVYPGVLSY